jgi:hypothetical protein
MAVNSTLPRAVLVSRTALGIRLTSGTNSRQWISVRMSPNHQNIKKVVNEGHALTWIIVRGYQKKRTGK